MTTIENFPVNLGSDLAALAKNSWTVEVNYFKAPASGYRVRARRDSWVIRFRYLDDDSTFTDGKLYKHTYGQAVRARLLTREQVRRIASMSNDGLLENWGKATI